LADETRRTAGDLLEVRDRLAEEKQRQAAEQAAQKQTRRARARARHLESLAGREEELWKQVEAAIQTRQPKEYDHAVELLMDLRDLGEHSGTGAEMTERLRALRGRHRSKPSLLKRLDRAGLPK
jgi:hypothetical protein